VPGATTPTNAATNQPAVNQLAVNQQSFVRSAREQPGPRDRILDLYGTFIRDNGGWIAVADLVGLLETLGINPASGRSTLSRMKRRGEIESVSRGSVRGYGLPELVDQWFADGTARIMNPAPNDGDSGADVRWAMASFTVPEEDRSVRYRIRSRLTKLGFGQLAGGLMIAPAYILEESRRAIERADLHHYVDFWQSEHVGFRSVAEIISHAWNLDGIDEAYREYLELADNLEAKSEPDEDAEVFLRYVVNINAWRERPFLDPGLPAAHLPPTWRGAGARERFTGLEEALRPGALGYYTTTTQAEP
jgi:phenylacetic acid degradation operon negative regulatory protein